MEKSIEQALKKFHEAVTNLGMAHVDLANAEFSGDPALIIELTEIMETFYEDYENRWDDLPAEVLQPAMEWEKEFWNSLGFGKW